MFLILTNSMKLYRFTPLSALPRLPFVLTPCSVFSLQKLFRPGLIRQERLTLIPRAPE